MISSNSPIHRVVPPALPPHQIAKLRRKLIEERDRIVSDYQRDFSAAQSTREEGAEDLEELANIYQEREFLFARSEEDRQKLLLIEEALQRMAEGTYGLCQWSGEPISRARLQFIPWARYSIDVQEKMEAGQLTEAARQW
ncbi:MAG TPA: TraR/DksA family transcriptional regulator [Thermoanaerobaculia bacterium]|nr:TraR/DksA family transcriptional regulator [Thermoanaerobaculia bacterium]